MAWNANLTNLRDVLADLYFTPQDARRVAQESGLNPAFISFDARSINTWFSILDEANKRDKVHNIVTVAHKEYPENELLDLAMQSDLSAVRGPDIDTKVTWNSDLEPATLEKIIGAQRTLFPISFLEIGLQKSRSVVRVVRVDGDTGSGFLTTDNLLITNHHVLSTEAEAQTARIQFNYQKTATGLDAPAAEFQLEPGNGFATSKDDDWTGVRVAGNPAAEWGELPLHPRKVEREERVIVIQHPGGGAKHIALYHNVVAYADDKRVQYLTDTMPGSSGSPVFDQNWNVVALHYTGGWLREPGSKQVAYRNEGIHIGLVVNGLEAAGLL